ncbi:MAG: hypothetical protein RL186_543 [Pseudomonadota bacterium]
MTRVDAVRAALLAGDLQVPIALGLKPVHRPLLPPHFERSEQAAFQQALPEIASMLGRAVRVIACGPFAALWLGPVLDVLEQPKAGILLSHDMDDSQFARIQEGQATAQISVIPQGDTDAPWVLPDTGAGKSLIVMAGLGFPHLAKDARRQFLDQASLTLKTDDCILLSLEAPRDAAAIEADYRDWVHHTVSNALAQIGRADGLEPRLHYDPARQALHMGALARGCASLHWSGETYPIADGRWLDFGALQLGDPTLADTLHQDFEAAGHWTCPQGRVAVILLRKR